MTTSDVTNLKELLNHLNVGVFRLSDGLRGRFIFTNEALSRILGWRQDELSKMNLFQLFESSRTIKNFYKRLKKQNLLKEEEIHLKRKNGTPVLCRLTVSLLKDENGTVKGLEGLVEDLTFQKANEKALLESKELFRVIFDSAIAAITVADKEERLIAWNPAAEKMFGMEKKELFNLPVKALYPPSEWRRIRASRARTRGLLSTIETKVISANHKTLDVDLSVSVLKDSQGKIIGSIGIIRDITKSKVAERKLKDSEGKIRIILDNSAAAITLLDQNEKIISWNRFTEQLLGMAKKDLYMKPVSILYPPDEWQKIRAAEIRKTGSKHHIQTKVIRKDKAIIDIDLSVNVLRDSENNIVGSVGIMQDVTEQKRVQEELIQAKIVAEEASHSKSLFLANVSHEVRTPMNAILGMVDMTLDTTLTSEQRENLQTVKDAAGNLLDLLNDILDLSRIEAGKINLELIEFNLRDVIKNICRGLHVLARNKNLELLWSAAPEVPEILKGDPVRLRQVIINLVNNAIKFTAKGKVEIKVRPESLKEKDCDLIFSVMDTGIGIPKDKQEAIFEAFVQADDSITRRYGGTGLGLAISKRLVDMMNGRIWVESQEGKGSTFNFTSHFSVVSQGAASAAQGQSKKEEVVIPVLPGDDLGPLKILLAEDNLVSQRIMVKILAKRGWTVSVAENGQIVLGLISKESFDLVLMDVQMPLLDGLETTRLIREGEKQTGKHISIIAMTARAMEEDRIRCLAAGMDGYVSKPIDRMKLFSTMAEIIKKGKNHG